MMINEEFDDIEKRLWEQMGKLPTPEPSKKMKTRGFTKDFRKNLYSYLRASIGSSLLALQAG